VWIISKSRLREFWEVCSDAKTPLEAWYKHVENADWTMTSDVKADYGAVDFVGNCAVFNIGGNKYRLIARIIYHIHKVFVLRVMTHHEYDTTNWEKDCGCHSPPPKKTKKAKKTSSKKRKRR
jgi:mRNA interferase HigB